jgi:hypothetical protein
MEGIENTGFNKNIIISLTEGSPLIAQGNPYEIRIQMNNPVILIEIQ